MYKRQVHSQGNYAAAQMVLSGESPDAAAQYVEDIAAEWRTMSTEEVEHFKDWAENYTE